MAGVFVVATLAKAEDVAAVGGRAATSLEKSPDCSSCCAGGVVAVVIVVVVVVVVVLVMVMVGVVETLSCDVE